LNGRLQDFRIYADVLSASEIAALAKSDYETFVPLASHPSARKSDGA